MMQSTKSTKVCDNWHVFGYINVYFHTNNGTEEKVTDEIVIIIKSTRIQWCGCIHKSEETSKSQTWSQVQVDIETDWKYDGKIK